MQWFTIQQHYPQKWLVIEAVKAHSFNNERILDDIAVIESFMDSRVAFQYYTELHKQAPQRELYVVHTNMDALQIEERHWLGIRSV